MTVNEACRILGIHDSDDFRTVKIKYRRLMRLYHPDAAGSDDRHNQHAQRINEAYAVIKASAEQRSGNQPDQSAPFWNSKGHFRSERKQQNYFQHWKINPNAYTERNIYDSYHMDLGHLEEEERQAAQAMYQQIGRGKYFWNPDEEDFSCFLKSLHHAVYEILRRAELAYTDDEELLSEFRFPFQIRLFHLIGCQYVRPITCLHQILSPERVDREGREIFRIRAFLGTKERGELYRNISALSEGELLYPKALKENRLVVMNRERTSLGFLSLALDELYFCLIPLLQKHQAQIQMRVIRVQKFSRPLHVRAEVSLHVRLNGSGLMEADEVPDTGPETAAVLEEYRSMLKQMFRVTT